MARYIINLQWTRFLVWKLLFETWMNTCTRFPRQLGHGFFLNDVFFLLPKGALSSLWSEGARLKFFKKITFFLWVGGQGRYELLQKNKSTNVNISYFRIVINIKIINHVSDKHKRFLTEVGLYLIGPRKVIKISSSIILNEY